MNRFLISILAVTLLALPGAAREADKEDLSLEKAISRALEKNFQVKILRQQERSAGINNSWGAAGAFPTINLGLDLDHSRVDAPASAGDGRLTTTANSASPYVTLRWTLFNGFGVSITKRKLALLEQVSRGNTALTVENAIQAVILAYYNALLQQEQLKIAREVRALSKDRYDYVKMKKDLGSAGTYDELQAKIAYLDDVARCQSQMLNLNTALRSLNQVMGEAGDKAYRLTGTFTHEPREYALEDLEKKMEDSNRTLRNQLLNAALRENDVRLSRSAAAPTVSLNSGAGAGFAVSRPGSAPRVNASTYNYYVGFTLNLTLSDGGRVRRAIANALINRRIAQLQIDELRLSLRNSLTNLLERYDIRRRLLEVAEEKMASARLSLEISGDKFRSGAINSFNYRDAQLLYLNAAFEKLAAIYDIIDTHTELARLTGAIVVDREEGRGKWKVESEKDKAEYPLRVH